MRRVLIILEGAADRPIKAFKSRTPLQIARTPVLDQLATIGTQGSVDVGGTRGGSEQHLWSLIGKNAGEWPHGSGILEAIGLGMEISPEHWYLSAGLVTLGDHIMSDPRGGQLSEEEARTLFSGLNAMGIGLEYTWFEGNRAILRVPKSLWSGEAVSVLQKSPELLDGENLAHLLPHGAVGDAWLRSCERLWEEDVNLVRVDLGEVPANGIWWWGGPSDPSLPVGELAAYSAQLKGGVVTDSRTFSGLARTCGMEPRRVTQYKGQKSYYSDRLAEVAELLGTHEIVVVHAARPLECSLRGALDEKVWALEGLDQLLLRPLLEMLNGVGGWRVIVTAGAVVSVEQRRFTSDPVPFLMAGTGVSADSQAKWSEQTAITGAGGRLFGPDIWKLLVES